MKIKTKRLKNNAQLTGMVKMKINNYPCLRNGTRHPCNYHCKKCYFEVIYCQSS